MTLKIKDTDIGVFCGIRIRIQIRVIQKDRIRPDPDPQHWFLGLFYYPFYSTYINGIFCNACTEYSYLTVVSIIHNIFHTDYENTYKSELWERGRGFFNIKLPEKMGFAGDIIFVFARNVEKMFAPSFQFLRALLIAFLKAFFCSLVF